VLEVFLLVAFLEITLAHVNAILYFVRQISGVPPYLFSVLDAHASQDKGTQGTSGTVQYWCRGDGSLAMGGM